MAETKQCPSTSSFDVTSIDLSSALLRRVGIVATLVTAGLVEEYASRANRRPAEVSAVPVKMFVPVDPLIAESIAAFEAGTTIGKEILVYFNSEGRLKTHFKHTREMSVTETATSPQGGLMGWDVSTSDIGPAFQFSNSDFEAWLHAQMAELQTRPDIKATLNIDGAGVLFSIDGSAFLTFLSGDRAQLRQLEPVLPFSHTEGPR